MGSSEYSGTRRADRAGRRSRLRRAATLALAAAAAAGSLTAGGASANAASGRQVTPPMAMTAGGTLVPVDTVFAPTPVHPEAITHPDADFAGSTVRSGPHTAAPALRSSAIPQLPGIDVSSFQGNVNWATVSKSIDFSYTKASEGTYYTNAYFANQYDGPYDYGVIRGAYHFGIPNNSSGQAQADYFISHGGGWSGDGKTLPGALDIEYNPYGSECYGLTQSQMVTWIHNFANEYASREHVYPVIYTTTDWWSSCTGNNSGFAANDPLWIANFTASGGGPLPAGWGFYTFWQYADSGSLPGDQDVFNGAYSQLQTLATRG